MYRNLLILIAFLSGCASPKSNYVPNSDDALLIIKSDYYESKKSNILDRMSSKVEVFYSDEGCPDFKYDDGYIGTYEINNGSNNMVEVSVPKNKNIFLVNDDSRTQFTVTYRCKQGAVFTAKNEKYVYEISGIKMGFALPNDRCVSHEVYSLGKKLPRSEVLPIPYKTILMDYYIDKDACNAQLANKLSNGTP